MTDMPKSNPIIWASSFGCYRDMPPVKGAVMDAGPKRHGARRMRLFVPFRPGSNTPDLDNAVLLSSVNIAQTYEQAAAAYNRQIDNRIGELEREIYDLRTKRVPATPPDTAKTDENDPHGLPFSRKSDNIDGGMDMPPSHFFRCPPFGGGGRDIKS